METASTLSQDIIDEFVSVAHGDFERVKLLLNKYPGLVHERASWNEMGIEAAAQTGQLEIIEYLLAAGATLDICTAAVLGQKDQVEAFLSTDPGLVNAIGAHGIPLLYFPVIMGYMEITQLVLAHGADVNAGQGGNTALHGAVLFNQPGMVSWLLSQGAAYDPLDYNNKTPLDLAVEKGSEEIIALLRKPTDQA